MSADTLQTREIDAATVKRWLDSDRAVVIDVREPIEHRREHIPGARLMPLADLNLADLRQDAGKAVVCQCRSGSRSARAAARVLADGFDQVYSLRGGIEAWKQAGLPVQRSQRPMLDVLRQMQILAGSLVLLGAVLSLLLSPWWIALSGVIGAGLVVAGATGSCGMTRVLNLLPWNRPPTAA